MVKIWFLEEIEIRVFRDLLVHWCGSYSFEQIVSDGFIARYSSFTDNPQFGGHDPQWLVGFVFNKKDVPHVFLEDIVERPEDYAKELRERVLHEPDVPYWRWEREHICTDDVPLEYVKCLTYCGIREYTARLLGKIIGKDVPVYHIDRLKMREPLVKVSIGRAARPYAYGSIIYPYREARLRVYSEFWDETFTDVVASFLGSEYAEKLRKRIETDMRRSMFEKILVFVVIVSLPVGSWFLLRGLAD